MYNWAQPSLKICHAIGITHNIVKEDHENTIFTMILYFNIETF